jgi:hypothetical protein
VKCLLGPDRLRRVAILAHVGQAVEAVGGVRKAQPLAARARGGLRSVAHQMPDMSLISMALVQPHHHEVPVL